MSIGIVIPSDDQLPIAAMDFDDLSDYQAAVGGYVEAIPFGEEGLSFFANDQAKLIGLPFNRRATVFWWFHTDWFHTAPLQVRDSLSGDVVLVGPADRHGNTLSVPDSLHALLFTLSAFAAEVKANGASPWRRAPHVFGDYFQAAAWGFDIAGRHGADVRVIACARRHTRSPEAPQHGGPLRLHGCSMI